VFCDTHLDDMLAVQYCKNKGILTATLQHGHMGDVKKVSQAGFDSSVHMRYSISDFFLTFGKYSKDLLLKNGISGNKIVCLGMMNHIGLQRCEKLPNKTLNVFGVLLNWELSKEGNKKMILLANKLALRFNMKYKIKFHPSNCRTEYKEFIDENYYIEETSDVTINDFIKEIQFGIVSKSTVVLDLVYGLVPFIKYTYDDNDMFSSITEFNANCYGEAVEKLNNLFENRIQYKNSLVKCRNYIFEDGDVKEHYKTFFKKFLL
jgi:hypothetical protein